MEEKKSFTQACRDILDAISEDQLKQLIALSADEFLLAMKKVDTGDPERSMTVLSEANTDLTIVLKMTVLHHELDSRDITRRVNEIFGVQTDPITDGTMAYAKQFFTAVRSRVRDMIADDPEKVADLLVEQIDRFRILSVYDLSENDIGDAIAHAYAASYILSEAFQLDYTDMDRRIKYLTSTI